MVDQVDLTVKNFFTYYLFNPQSEDLSPGDQKIALIGTFLLGLTAGIGHIFCYFAFYENRKITRDPPPNADRVNQAGQPIINASTIEKEIEQYKKNIEKTETPQEFMKNSIEIAERYQKLGNLKEAAHWYKEGALKGDPLSLIYLENLLVADPSLIKNFDEINQVCLQKMSITNFEKLPMEFLFLIGGKEAEKKMNMKKAVEFYSKGARFGYKECFDNLENLYKQNNSLIEDFDEIKKEYEKNKNKPLYPS